MATFYNNQQDTQRIKEFLKQHSQPKTVGQKEQLVKSTRTLPIRGQTGDRK
jgi:hypothetical protein